MQFSFFKTKPNVPKRACFHLYKVLKTSYFTRVVFNSLLLDGKAVEYQGM
jgi:hypothetical protein